MTDETLALTREGYVELRGSISDILAWPGGRPTMYGQPRYWLRACLADGGFPSESIPRDRVPGANVVDVEALATFNDETLGESDGFPQEYTLRHTPVDPESLTIEVDVPGLDPDLWTRKDDFLNSKAGDLHYVLNATSGVVRFGDGRNGQIPPPGALPPSPGRTTRAEEPRAMSRPARSVHHPPMSRASTSATNPRAATGGVDEESLQQLQDRTPRSPCVATEQSL